MNIENQQQEAESEVISVDIEEQKLLKLKLFLKKSLPIVTIVTIVQLFAIILMTLRSWRVTVKMFKSASIS